MDGQLYLGLFSVMSLVWMCCLRKQIRYMYGVIKKSHPKTQLTEVLNAAYEGVNHEEMYEGLNAENTSV